MVQGALSGFGAFRLYGMTRENFIVSTIIMICLSFFSMQGMRREHVSILCCYVFDHHRIMLLLVFTGTHTFVACSPPVRCFFLAAYYLFAFGAALTPVFSCCSRVVDVSLYYLLPLVITQILVFG